MFSSSIDFSRPALATNREKKKTKTTRMTIKGEDNGKHGKREGRWIFNTEVGKKKEIAQCSVVQCSAVYVKWNWNQSHGGRLRVYVRPCLKTAHD